MHVYRDGGDWWVMRESARVAGPFSSEDGAWAALCCLQADAD